MTYARRVLAQAAVASESGEVRLPHTMTIRNWIVDAVVAALLTGYAFAAALTTTEYPNPGIGTALLLGLAGLALVIRRRLPTVSFIACLGAMSAAALIFGSYQAGSALLIGIVAAYSAMAYGVALAAVAGMVVLFAAAEALGGGPNGGISSALFCVLVLGFAGAGGLLARRLRQLSAANAALRELVERESEATTRAAVDDERARIARELHDILSHSLAVVALQTAAAEHAWTSDPERAGTAVRAARLTCLEAVEQLQTLVKVVRDDPGGRLPLATMGDLAQLAASTTAAGFVVDYRVIGEPRPVSPQVQASVYRVAQEGISNAMKHSGGRRCSIKLTYEEQAVVVEVDDDGRQAVQGPGSAMGLVGIEERAAIFDGVMSAGKGSDGGWRLRVAFPS